MARYVKGQSGNPAGKKKGTPNRTTEQLRSMVQTLIESNWNRIQFDLDQMKPSERLNFIYNLLKFVLPDPVSYEKLSEEQLEQLHEYLQRKYSYENEFTETNPLHGAKETDPV